MVVGIVLPVALIILPDSQMFQGISLLPHSSDQHGCKRVSVAILQRTNLRCSKHVLSLL